MSSASTTWSSLRSTVPGVVWPALVPGMPATLLALLQQLETTQWWSAEQLAAAQRRQLRVLAEYAVRHSPHFAARLRAAGLTVADLLTTDGFAALPPLRRADIQNATAPLVCDALPQAHQPVSDASSSGSTGEPVTVKRSAVNHLFWLAFTLREHLWHQRDFSGRLAAIRTRLTPDSAAVHPDWGVPVSLLFESGQGFALPINRDAREQLDWLLEVDPHYLITYPSNLAALLDEIERRGCRLPALKQLRTIGETVPPLLAARVQRQLGIGIADIYSSQELGMLALQCPHSGMYHAMAEGYIVEVLDENGRPCDPGEIGRLVVTDLHNLAMPLVRYDTSDYAEVGPACGCGRGLPTLRRILGRERNMVNINGHRHWPLYGFDHFPEIVPTIRQYQLIQHALDAIEVKLFSLVPPDEQQQQALRRVICDTLGHEFTISFTLLSERMPAAKSGKFEEFLCLV